MTRTRIMLLLAAGLIAGALAGWIRPVPSGLGASADAGGEWSLLPAAAVERASAEMLETALQLRWVGGGAGQDAAGSEAVDTSWTLRGLLPTQESVLVQTGADPLIKRMATGDILPDGSRIIAVESDAVTVQLDDCQIRRNLYPRADDNRPLPDQVCTEMSPEKETSPP